MLGIWKTNLKIDNFRSAPESTIFNQSRWNFDEAQLQTLVYTCVKFKGSSFIPSYELRVHKVLGIWKTKEKIGNFQSAPESTIFNRSRWNFDEARLQTLVYMCIKFKSIMFDISNSNHPLPYYVLHPFLHFKLTDRSDENVLNVFYIKTRVFLATCSL